MVNKVNYNHDGYTTLVAKGEYWLSQGYSDKAGLAWRTKSMTIMMAILLLLERIIMSLSRIH